MSWLFARRAVREAVVTRMHLNASQETVWKNIMLYEEVPRRPPFLLRAFLPQPVRTEGDKTRIGATVRCAYREGDLVKRITTVEPPRFLQFEVIAQSLGIESCILTLGGSYQIHARGDLTEVVLTTIYQAHLHPRSWWRPVESLLVSQLHGHILSGVSAAVLPRRPVLRPATAPSPGGLSCTTSQSYFRR